MSKLKISVPITEFGGYEMSGDLKEIIEKLNSYIYSNENLFDFKIETESEGGYYGDHSVVIKIYAYRLETDDEYNQRMETNKKKSVAAKVAAERQRLANEQREKTLYENLKKKYEAK